MTKEIEWEFQASVIGTVWATTKEEAKSKAAQEFGIYMVDVEWVEPVDPDELEEDEDF